jgi:dihydrofolate synthase/folylpolyglutamate synthase
MAATEYAEVLAWLYGLEAARGMDFKLERVALALKKLGDPHRTFASVHIAGTNGKGSVAAMLHSIFQAAGYRVGLYTSPHLMDFTERIRIDAEMIAAHEVVQLARQIRVAATADGVALTFFEFVTVMAFLHFARRGVDLAVVEVGLGGRLDATNVLDPEVAVITNIGLDHGEFLGNTLVSVAGEKAGIIKPGRPVVVGKVSSEVREVFQHTAAAQGAAVHWQGADFSVAGVQPVRFRGMGCELVDLSVPLRGAHQRDNAATAIAAALRLRRQFPFTDAALRRGLADVRWPGRLDVVQACPLVVLDGAHNADGVSAVVRALPEVVGGRKVHLLFGVMRDKLWQPMVEAMGPVVSTATLTTALASRGEAPETLAKAFAPYCPVRIAPQPALALERLLRSTASDDAILVIGSLFLVGAVYPYFLGPGKQLEPFCAAAGTMHV